MKHGKVFYANLKDVSYKIDAIKFSRVLIANAKNDITKCSLSRSRKHYTITFPGALNARPTGRTPSQSLAWEDVKFKGGGL